MSLEQELAGLQLQKSLIIDEMLSGKITDASKLGFVELEIIILKRKIIDSTVINQNI